MRVYRAYANPLQSIYPSRSNFCLSRISQGALSMVILNYVNIILLSIIVIIVCSDLRTKIEMKKHLEMEMVPTGHINRL